MSLPIHRPGLNLNSLFWREPADAVTGRLPVCESQISEQRFLVLCLWVTAISHVPVCLLPLPFPASLLRVAHAVTTDDT